MKQHPEQILLARRRLFYLHLAFLHIILPFALFLQCSCGISSNASDGNRTSPSTEEGYPPKATDAQNPAESGGAPAPAEPQPLAVDSLRFAVEVVEVHFGAGGGYGADYLPQNVLGPPAGRGAFAPQTSSRELLSLGHGGWIVLRTGLEIVDGEGADFLVFENPFYAGGVTTSCTVEAAVVEVSADGADWRRLPFDYEPAGAAPYADPANFHGFAGVHPVTANLALGINPLDPAAAGGDAFDLSAVGLARARYIKIIDSGSAERAPGTEISDADGDVVDDMGNHAPPTEDREGFDLDAVAVLNAGEKTE